MSWFVDQSGARTDSADRGFPDPAIRPTHLLRPLRSWRDVYEEAGFTGIQFDAFWYEAVMDGVCAICRWLGNPRATVLVVYGNHGVRHVECRAVGDRLMTRNESALIYAEVRDAFNFDGRKAPVFPH